MQKVSIQLYNHLLETPLFLGMSRGDLENIIGQTKFGFSRIDEGKKIVAEGDRCTSLLFLMQGTMEITTQSTDKSFSVTETLTAPVQIQPERLFGLHQYYSSTYKAKTICNFMTLSKDEIIRLTEEYLVFRINLLNIVATRLQKADNAMWHYQGHTLNNRIRAFFLHHCIRPAGRKTIKIKMTRLAEILGTSRLNVSIELNAMQDKGLITLSRGKIEIPQLEKLLMQ